MRWLALCLVAIAVILLTILAILYLLYRFEKRDHNEHRVKEYRIDEEEPVQNNIATNEEEDVDAKNKL